MEVVLQINFQNTLQFPEYASRKVCDYGCPMFLWDGEGYDFCVAQLRTDDVPVKCPFFCINKHVLNMK